MITGLARLCGDWISRSLYHNEYIYVTLAGELRKKKQVRPTGSEKHYDRLKERNWLGKKEMDV